MPGSAILQFNDPFEHQKSIRNSDVDLLVTARGDYRAGLTLINLHRLWMQRGWESLPRVARARLAVTRPSIFFLADPQQPPLLQSGREVERDHVVFYSPVAEHHHRTLSGCHWCAMSLSPEDFAAAGQAIAGHDLTAPELMRTIRMPPHLMARLRAFHKAACRLAATTPDVIAHPEVARAMEQELVRLMIDCLTEGAVVGNDVRAHRRVAIMRRFEQVLHEAQNMPCYVADICAAVGVPERTLHMVCKEHLGMAPHRYLWLRRMHQVRRALALADPTATTVTVAATDHGFWELGRFSVAYRNLFGESPSATLRRPPDLPARSAQGVSTGYLPILP